MDKGQSANWYGLSKSAKQVSWTENFGDVQRYLLDAYQVNVNKTATQSKHTVSLTVAHMQYGHIMWQTFWVYPLTEGSKAESTFKEAKVRVGNIIEGFIEGENPTTLLHAYLREELRDLDVEHQPIARIPWINHAKYERGEGDWRSTLYGTRYPTNTDGF